MQRQLSPPAIVSAVLIVLSVVLAFLSLGFLLASLHGLLKWIVIKAWPWWLYVLGTIAAAIHNLILFSQVGWTLRRLRFSAFLTIVITTLSSIWSIVLLFMTREWNPISLSIYVLIFSLVFVGMWSYCIREIFSMIRGLSR